MNKRYVICLLVCILLSLYAFRQQNPKGARVALGRTLFFDPILSQDSTLSCTSCHKPEFAFADTSAVSIGFHGNKGFRNTPSVMNMRTRTAFFWDGRAKTLQTQMFFPMNDTNEMALESTAAVKRLRNSKKYRTLFFKAFGRMPDKAGISQAIAAYEQTLETSNTPLDRWLNDKPDGLTEREREGRVVFLGKGQCNECHFTPDFTGDEFRNIGLFNGREWNDSGRFLRTRSKADLGKFKVPGLRNVAFTAPYMHNGRFKTLGAVIDYYNDPDAQVPDAINRDTLLQRPLHLTEREKQDLEAFLRALTDDAFHRQDLRASP